MSESERVENTMLLALNMEEGAISGGMQMANRHWERPGWILSQSSQKEPDLQTP